MAGAALRGMLFGACLSTGVAPGTTIDGTAPFTLYNPAASGKKIRPRTVSLGYISGTLGAGTMFHCVNPTTSQAAPTGGTNIVGTNLDAGRAGTSILPLPSPVGLAYWGATVAAPTAIRPFCTLLPILATSANDPFVITEVLLDDFVLEPGTSYQLQSVMTAGTTPLVAIGIEWEE